MRNRPKTLALSFQPMSCHHAQELKVNTGPRLQTNVRPFMQPVRLCLLFVDVLQEYTLYNKALIHNHGGADPEQSTSNVQNCASDFDIVDVLLLCFVCLKIGPPMLTALSFRYFVTAKRLPSGQYDV